MSPLKSRWRVKRCTGEAAAGGVLHGPRLRGHNGGRTGVKGRRLHIVLHRRWRARQREPLRGDQLHPRQARHYYVVVGADPVLLARCGEHDRARQLRGRPQYLLDVQLPQAARDALPPRGHHGVHQWPWARNAARITISCRTSRSSSEKGGWQRTIRVCNDAGGKHTTYGPRTAEFRLERWIGEDSALPC